MNHNDECAFAFIADHAATDIITASLGVNVRFVEMQGVLLFLEVHFAVAQDIVCIEAGYIHAFDGQTAGGYMQTEADNTKRVLLGIVGFAGDKRITYSFDRQLFTVLGDLCHLMVLRVPFVDRHVVRVMERRYCRSRYT